jgi:hypothetical protein
MIRGLSAMRIRLFFLLSSLLLLSCSPKNLHQPLNFNKLHIQPKIITLTDFTQIYIQGVINVNLHSGYKHPSVHLAGDPRDLKNVAIVVKGYALKIIMKKPPLYGPVTADIRAHELTTFDYKGAGSIVGAHLHTKQLNLNINNRGNVRLAGSIGLNNLKVKGSGLTTIHGVVGHHLAVSLKGKPKVQLSGIVNISRVNVDGCGWLGLYWVKSTDLTIRLHGSVQTQLAGITNMLDVELWDTAQFKGRYLRAKTSFVKTHGHSRAEISTINRQHTLALDASDIYYYHTAKFDSDFMGNNGAVLDLGRPVDPIVDPIID